MSESKWIIKSAGRLLGPWTVEELSDQIRSRQISVLDEVKEPLGRWVFVREHPLLKQVVRQVRDDQANVIENTQSTFVTSGKTVTSSVTERLIQEGEMTHPGGGDGMVSINAKEKNLGAAGLGNNAYGVLSDPKARGKIDQSVGLWMYGVYAIGLIAIVSAILFYRTHSAQKLNAQQAEETARTSAELAQRGEYSRSLEMISKVATVRPLRPAEQILKVKLLLAMEDASIVEALRILEQLQANSSFEGASIDLLKGLVNSRLSKSREAATSYQAALNGTVQTEEARLNLAALSLSVNDHQRAWSLLKSPRAPHLRPFHQILKSLVALSVKDESRSKEWSALAFNEMRTFDQQDTKDRPRLGARELRFERNMLLAALALRAGLKPQVAEMVHRALQSNPMEAREYLRTPVLEWPLIGWNLMLEPCREIRDSAGPQEAGPFALWSLCLVAAGDMVKARTDLDSAIRRLKQNPYLAAADALTLLAAGRKPEAERIAEAYPNSDQVLLTWVQAVGCEDRLDVACAERAWEQLKGLDPGEPRAHYGIARIAKDLNNEPRYISASSQGLRYAPNYRPLLQLTGGRYEF